MGERLTVGISVAFVTVLHLLVLYVLRERYLSLSQGIHSAARPQVSTLTVRLNADVSSFQAPRVTKLKTMNNRVAQPSTQVLPIAAQRPDNPGEEVGAMEYESASATGVALGDRQTDYWPRESLSRAPVALSEIDIPFPAIDINEHKIDVALAVYIDEQGTVRYVRVENAGIPLALENTAVSAFMAARFQPGQIEGTVVRSLIKVLVTFESIAIDGLNRPR